MAKREIKLCTWCGKIMEPWIHGWHLCDCGNRYNEFDGWDDAARGLTKDLKEVKPNG